MLNQCQKAIKQRREEAQDQSTQDTVSHFSICPESQMLTYCSEETMHQEN